MQAFFLPSAKGGNHSFDTQWDFFEPGLDKEAETFRSIQRRLYRRACLQRKSQSNLLAVASLVREVDSVLPEKSVLSRDETPHKPGPCHSSDDAH